MFALTMSLAACNNVSNLNETNTPALGAYGIATENMDLTIKPGDNFFKYVNAMVPWLRDGKSLGTKTFPYVLPAHRIRSQRPSDWR